MTRKKVTYALAQSMREFGYPDVTDEMAGEILDAYVAEERSKDHRPNICNGASDRRKGRGQSRENNRGQIP